jgi:hypothetical protein
MVARPVRVGIFVNMSIDVLAAMASWMMRANARDIAVVSTDSPRCKKKTPMRNAGSSVDTAPPAMHVASSAKVAAEDVRQGKLARVLAEFVVSNCHITHMGGVALTHSDAPDCSCSGISHFVIDALQFSLSVHGLDHTFIHMFSLPNLA